MGPFPHTAAPATITADNPVGTDGFAFVEFAHPHPEELARLFVKMGFVPFLKHRDGTVTIFRQGDIDFIVTSRPGSHAQRFAETHGPSAPAMGWKMVDAERALSLATERGAEIYCGDDKTFDVPAIQGIGGSLIYFVDRDADDLARYGTEFVPVEDGPVEDGPEGSGEIGFSYIDHLTHNVQRGNMDRWFSFYADIFNFRQIRFFDIEGKHTGLFSRALTSPCGRIRIPINESADETSQIEEYLRDYKGEGIQHIALGSNDLYAGVDQLAANGIQFMPAPPDTYYESSHNRVPGHAEPIAKMREHGILIDGEGVVEADGAEGPSTRILLQIFSKTVIGPIFFEFIQRKGDDGFGEGNFRALFDSIEEDQIRRGVLAPAT